MTQLTYNSEPAIGRAGVMADSRLMKHVQSRLAATAVKAGYGVFRVPGSGQPGSFIGDPGSVYQIPTPASAADVDAILATGGASSTSIQTISGAALNGVVGTSSMYPPRQVTLVLSNHADWDATNATLTYVNAVGETVSETLAIPNTGNTTLTSTGYASRVISLVIPAQSGTGGTYTIGIAVLDGTVNLADFDGIAEYDAAITPDTATPAEYPQGATVSVVYKGAVWVTTEDACSAGAAVYVRIGGTGTLGAFRSDADTSNAVAVTGARYLRDSGAGALNIVELY